MVVAGGYLRIARTLSVSQSVSQWDHSDSHPDLVSSSPVEGAGEIIASAQRNYSNRGAPTLRPGDGVQDGEDPADGAVTPAD